MRAFGADAVERESADEIWLLSARSKSWLARRPGARTRPEHPGTAVEWEGAIFEVRRAEPLPQGGIRYVLARWPDNHAIRRMEQYDAASEAGREAEQVRRRGSVRQRRLSIVLAPLAGLLPGIVQKRMESEFGAPALGMTISSALPLFAIGFLGTFESFVGRLGGGLGLPVWLSPPAPIALYLFAESALRLASAAVMLEPMGTFPVELGYALGHRRAAPPRPSAPAGSVATDRYRMLEPLLSLLPEADQRLLAARFGFDGIRWGRITAAILFFVGAPNAMVAVVNLAAGVSGALDLVWLVAGSALGFEQVRRWRRLARGQPAGSVLGVLVRPFAERLLDPRPPSA